MERVFINTKEYYENEDEIIIEGMENENEKESTEEGLLNKKESLTGGKAVNLEEMEPMLNRAESMLNRIEKLSSIFNGKGKK